MEGAGRKLFIETYGCQMNVGDTEIVVSLMQREGYVYTDRIGEADVILINTQGTVALQFQQHLEWRGQETYREKIMLLSR